MHKKALFLLKKCKNRPTILDPRLHMSYLALCILLYLPAYMHRLFRKRLKCPSYCNYSWNWTRLSTKKKICCISYAKHYAN